MPTSLVIRFADRVSQTQTTHERLKALADHFGVSQNKAAHMAINRLYDETATDRAIEAEFLKHGRKVGGVTYLHAPEDFLLRVEDRIRRGIPLPHEDDDALEHNLLFKLLPPDVQACVISATDPMDKRRLIDQHLRESKERRSSSRAD